ALFAGLRLLLVLAVLPFACLLLHLFGEFLGLLPQLALIARELFELPAQFLFAHLRALLGELLLLLEEFVLPPRQLLDLVERALLLILALLRARFGFVVGLLRFLQLLVEQRRHGVVAAIVAGSAAGLLPRDLAF